MKVEVFIKSVYGRENIYPACDTAKKFLKLTGRLTFNDKDLHVIKSLGYEIELVNQYQIKNSFKSQLS